MSFIFGAKPKPEEVVRKHLGTLRSASRELNREVMRLQTQEKKLIGDIKNTARKGEVTMKSTNQMANAMAGVTKALTSMNRQMNLPQIQKILANFEKQTDILDMKQEAMEDAIDEITGAEEDDEETEQVVNKVLEELGVSISQQLSTPVASNELKKAESSEDIGDLQSRLDKLKRS